MDTRRSIADRVIARARARGTPIDEDLDYMAIVELWVEGAIDDKGMRQRYIELLERRRDSRRNTAEDDSSRSYQDVESVETVNAIDPAAEPMPSTPAEGPIDEDDETSRQSS